jgi:hypothetical protein
MPPGATWPWADEAKEAADRMKAAVTDVKGEDERIETPAGSETGRERNRDSKLTEPHSNGLHAEAPEASSAPKGSAEVDGLPLRAV